MTSHEREFMIDCLIVLAVSTSLLVGGVLWALAGGGKPIRGLPRAPGYPLTCLFGAAWNAIVVHSLWATAFCLALAGLFQLSEGWTEKKKTWTVVGVCLSVMATMMVWLVGFSGH